MLACHSPRLEQGVLLPLVRDALEAQQQDGPSAGVRERLRGLQQLVLDGFSQREPPTDFQGTASPLGRGWFDVTHRRDEDSSWWIADRRILRQDEQGAWIVADEGVLVRPDDARIALVDEAGVFDTGIDTARVARSVLLVLVDERLLVVDLPARTCFVVP